MSQAELAYLLGVTTRTVARWVELGLPRIGEGRKARYPLRGCIAFQLARERELAARRVGPADLKAEQARLFAARASLSEYELAEKERRMLDTETAGRELARVLDRLRAVILNLPGRAATDLIGLRSYGEARTALEKIVDRLCQALVATADEIESDADVPGESRGPVEPVPPARRGTKRTRRRRAKGGQTLDKGPAT